ncbi:MAG: DUF4266 domain-containing protein [Alphaproteobacteria bacterium]|nr:DUF4266 domain-containing protein [Alphaproteobacteria bacterium]MDE2492729.1 DUF4266 domain-containing protein [Alphaproteobacteria bacterium]
MQDFIRTVKCLTSQILANCSTRRRHDVNLRISPFKRAASISAVCTALALLCGACSSIGPKPWEKDLMARKEMQVDSHPMLTAAEEHIYFSKEASSGGRGFAGGGCGCN